MILVIAEQRDGKLNRATWEAIAGGAAAGRRPVQPIAVARRSARASARRRGGARGRAGAGSRHASSTPALEPYTPDGYTAALQHGDRAS